MRKAEIVKLLADGTGLPAYEATVIVDVLAKAGALNITTGSEEANRIIDAFKQAHNVPSVRPTDRTSARTLAQSYGAENVIQIIEIMKNATWEYKPSINHIKDVETKWLMIRRYLEKNQHRGETGI